jgi:hypothetical protein
MSDALPIQRDNILRRSRDAGLNGAEIDALCLHVGGCSLDALSFPMANEVLVWLVLAGPERAKARVAALLGRREWL